MAGFGRGLLLGGIGLALGGCVGEMGQTYGGPSGSATAAPSGYAAPPYGTAAPPGQVVYAAPPPRGLPTCPVMSLFPTGPCQPAPSGGPGFAGSLQSEEDQMTRSFSAGAGQP